MLLFTFSCEEKDSSDVTAPGKLSIDSITPTNGGGIISYTLPDDNDILFVRAEYTNTLGVDVFRVSSVHNNEIEIYLNLLGVAGGNKFFNTRQKGSKIRRTRLPTL